MRFLGPSPARGAGVATLARRQTVLSVSTPGRAEEPAGEIDAGEDEKSDRIAERGPEIDGHLQEP